MTRKHLMMRIHSYSFEECGVSLNCYYSQVLFDPELGSDLRVKIEVFDNLQAFMLELLALNSNTGNHLTVCKQMSSGSFKNFHLHTIRLQIIYIWHMHKQDLTLNNL